MPKKIYQLKDYTSKREIIDKPDIIYPSEAAKFGAENLFIRIPIKVRKAMRLTRDNNFMFRLILIKND